MCAMCDGQSADEFMAGVIADIDSAGWAVISVEDERGEHVCSYTVGLTRFYGHPELIVSGRDFPTAFHVLDTLAAGVRDGQPLAAGQLLRPGGVESLLVPVADPSRLALAQAVYGAFIPVAALQVVWADEGGRWPWQMCEHHRSGQELYGPPPAPRG